MIEINNQIIMTDTYDILLELRRQLEINGYPRFRKFIISKNNIQTNCPFHKEGQERKPSFGISKKDGACHCFGCGWSGSISEMISNCFGHDDFGLFGNKWLIKNFLTVSVSERKDICLNLNRGKNISTTNFVSELELDKYREYHPYMWKRKLTPEIVELFDIGYDKETDCITFPNRDKNGNTLFVARRSVNTKFFNYPESAEKPVYGLYEINHCLQDLKWVQCEEVIICESMLDALTCWVYGKYAVALNGLGNDLQFKQLNNMPCRKFIIATDMDERGLNARKKIKKALKGKIVTEYVWDLSIAKDINDMSLDYFSNLKEIF